MEINATPYTLKMLRHIFGGYQGIALDYIQLLLQQPTQKLPILILTGGNNQIFDPRGLSTFTKWLSALVGNGAYNCHTSLDLTAPFNNEWAEKNLIVIDAILVGREILDIPVSLNRIEKIRVDKMHSKSREVDFNGRFIITCNGTTEMAYKEAIAQRVWIKTVKPLDFIHPNYFEYLQAEIPAFLKLLESRTIVHPKKFALWFNPALLTPPQQ